MTNEEIKQHTLAVADFLIKPLPGTEEGLAIALAILDKLRFVLLAVQSGVFSGQ